MHLDDVIGVITAAHKDYKAYFCRNIVTGSHEEVLLLTKGLE